MNKKFQVFVSSTYSDLKTERQACVEAILTAGHIPAGMELFSAGDETQLDIIKRWIDDSDIYMLLLGGRYGSIDPISGCSYTEFEYRYAVDSGKPFFALVMADSMIDEKNKREGKEVLELENPQKYKEFRQLVLSKISKFFINTDKLQLGIMQSLADIQSRHTLTGWVRSDGIIDSAKILNQITELTERNKYLEGKISILNSQMEIKDPLELVQSLSSEARFLLENLALDVDGGIRLLYNNEFFVNQKRIPSDTSPRNVAIWRHAFNELMEFKLIYSKSESDYLLTKFGFEVADSL